MNKIEGGPVCRNAAELYYKCDGGIIKGEHPDYMKYDGKSCWVCQGTGRKPLSEWTDAQKAEWLARELNYYSFEDGWYRDEDDEEWVRAIVIYNEKEERIAEARSHDKEATELLSQALTAAVECVAKEKE